MYLSAIINRQIKIRRCLTDVLYQARKLNLAIFERWELIGGIIDFVRNNKWGLPLLMMLGSHLTRLDYLKARMGPCMNL